MNTNGDGVQGLAVLAAALLSGFGGVVGATYEGDSPIIGALVGVLLFGLVGAFGAGAMAIGVWRKR